MNLKICHIFIRDQVNLDNNDDVEDDRDHTGERPYQINTRDTDDIDYDFEGFHENDSHTEEIVSMPSMSEETKSTNLRMKSALVDYSSDATTENYDTLESDLELVGYSSSSDDFSMDSNSFDSEKLIERELK